MNKLNQNNIMEKVDKDKYLYIVEDMNKHRMAEPFTTRSKKDVMVYVGMGVYKTFNNLFTDYWKVQHDHYEISRVKIPLMECKIPKGNK